MPVCTPCAYSPCLNICWVPNVQILTPLTSLLDEGMLQSQLLSHFTPCAQNTSMSGSTESA
jgi:hypothetical protein